MKKLVSLLTLALAFAAPVSQASAGVPIALVCGFGVPGFIAHQPDVLVPILALGVEFVPGTKRLGPTGHVEADSNFKVSITSQVPTGWDRYNFVAKKVDGTLLPITVSTREFKGRFAGLDQEVMKEAMAATMHMPLEQGKTQDVAGFCMEMKL